MGKFFNLSFIKSFLHTVLIFMVGCMGIVFTVLYIETFTFGEIIRYSNILTAVSVGLISVFTVMTLVFAPKSNSLLYKIFLLLTIVITAVMFLLYFFKKLGLLDKVDSIDDFRVYVSSFGSGTVIVFIIIQFLQVVVLPIPAFVTVGAGVLLFGAFKGALFSCIGIIAGSLVAYFLGRIFGVKLIKWLIGDNTLNKGLEMIKGKDKVVLTFMFLFPFFPDDVLCFVAGVTTIDSGFFILMIFATRIISVFASSYSINNSLIPYNTWWGIMLWIVFFAVTIVLTVFVCKKGESIENYFNRRRKASKSQYKSK